MNSKSGSAQMPRVEGEEKPNKNEENREESKATRLVFVC
jgi:hypothetical protein